MGKILPLYAGTVLIWGTTWLAIKFQLGTVDPMVSIAYRFGIASLLLFIFCCVSNLNMRFRLRAHGFMALQGFFLFAGNYWLFYLSEMYLPSGLVAVVFSTIVMMNIAIGAVLLKTAVEPRVMVGAVVGLGGISLVFWPEISSFDLADNGLYGLVLGLGATLLASIGNIISAYNQKKRLPVIQTNAYGMAYGALIMSAAALMAGKPFQVDLSSTYLISLLYLALFGSVVAFGCYLTLIGRIGAGRAAYATLLFPLVALGISTVFEGYQWSHAALAGVVLIMSGNLILIKRPQSAKDIPAKQPSPLFKQNLEQLQQRCLPK